MKMAMRRIGLTMMLLLLAVPAQAADATKDAAYLDGRKALSEALRRVPNTGRARNVILFIGDGMGINSVTAGRILADQRRGGRGLDRRLSFESFPYTGFSMTHSLDQFVTDSANGITAIVAGVKTLNGVIGVDGRVTRGGCRGSQDASISSIAEQAKARGLLTGVVTTSGVTDATPAGLFGHVADRNWRSDTEIPEDEAAAGCIDLARQLVEAPAGQRLDVVMGGDRMRFLPLGGEVPGMRHDGRDLVKQWLGEGGRAAFVDGRDALAAVDAAKTDRLLGLFADDNLPSPVDADRFAAVPSLEAMTRKAIEILGRNKKGYFLLVESASIDKWHHQNKAFRALVDVDELSKAVAAAQGMTDPRDTLIIVTADHSHTLALMGPLPVGSPVNGLAMTADGPARDGSGSNYPALAYGSGPGEGYDEAHPMPTQDFAMGPNYRQPAAVPTNSASHGGEDVPIYAVGPQAHLLTGTVESSYIYQVMAYALGLTDPPRKPKNPR